MVNKLCINFFGGPNSGKTLAAASLFTRLKKLHIDSELVAEFPKDLVLEDNKTALANQIYVFANQLYRVQCAYNNTTVSVVDSPLLLSAIYNPNTSKHLINLIFEQHKKFNHLNVFVERDLEFPHSMKGRIHSLTESITIDNQIVHLLENNNFPYISYREIGEDNLIQIITTEIGHTS
jgi:hypothetical protein